MKNIIFFFFVCIICQPYFLFANAEKKISEMESIASLSTIFRKSVNGFIAENSVEAFKLKKIGQYIKIIEINEGVLSLYANKTKVRNMRVLDDELKRSIQCALEIKNLTQRITAYAELEGEKNVQIAAQNLNKAIEGFTESQDKAKPKSQAEEGEKKWRDDLFSLLCDR